MNRVTILIPIYDEVQILKDTVEYFSSIAANAGINIVYITTEREGDIAHNPSFRMLSEITNGDDNSAVMHYPHRNGAKAAQLNWAMDEIGTEGNDYFAVFDADSRPDIEGVMYVIHSSVKSKIYQMPGNYLPHTSKSLASLAMSAFQSRWTFCFEIPKWLSWQNAKGGGRIMYVVGHGLFISPDLRFSENTLTEDLELGYRLSAKRDTLNLVPYFDYCTVPKTFITAVIQSSRWYYGELVLPKLIFEKLFTRELSLIYFFWFFVRYIQIMLWMFGPILVIYAVIESLGNTPLLTMNIISIIIYCYLLHYLTCRFLYLEYKSLLFMPAKSIVNCLGPFLSLMLVLLDKIGARKNTFVKTTR